MPPTQDLREYMEFAAETAYLAGRLTLGYFGTGVRPDFKADDSPVTVADRLAEQLIRGRIERAYPDHAIVGEEFGVTERAGARAETSHRWFIDPIDGTKSFMRGVPLYGVLLAWRSTAGWRSARPTTPAPMNCSRPRPAKDAGGMAAARVSLRPPT